MPTSGDNHDGSGRTSAERSQNPEARADRVISGRVYHTRGAAPHPHHLHSALHPSPLIRSASAPPDYVPPPPTSRQHRTPRGVHAWPMADDDLNSFPVPPEVIETRRRPKECSECCLKCVLVLTTLRWLFVSIALVGAACVVAGIAFGVMSSTLDKNTFFILSFIFIGLGIILVLVVGLGWRCAPAGHEPCHALCNLSETPSDGRLANCDAGTLRGTRLMQRSRNQWYGGFLYPEFRYGTPPPSYSTSMHQYRHRIPLPLDPTGGGGGGNSVLGNSSISSFDNVSSLPSSPPPTYQSRVSVRNRPSVSGILVSVSNCGDLPPPYPSVSRRPSLEALDAEDATGTTTTAPDQAVVLTVSGDVPNQLQDCVTVQGDPLPVCVPEVRENPESSSGFDQTEPREAVAPSSSSDPPSRDPLSVLNMVRRFEDLRQGLPGSVGTTDVVQPSGSVSQPDACISLESNADFYVEDGGSREPQMSVVAGGHSSNDQSPPSGVDQSSEIRVHKPTWKRPVTCPDGSQSRSSVQSGGNQSRSSVQSGGNQSRSSVQSGGNQSRSSVQSSVSQSPTVFTIEDDSLGLPNPVGLNRQQDDGVLHIVSHSQNNIRANVGLSQTSLSRGDMSASRGQLGVDFMRSQSLEGNEVGESGI